MIHIAIIDDDPRELAKLSRWIQTRDEMVVEGCFESDQAFLDKIDSLQAIDVLLLDIELKDSLGFVSIGKIKKHLPQLSSSKRLF